jgi:hypothetical protein
MYGSEAGREGMKQSALIQPAIWSDWYWSRIVKGKQSEEEESGGAAAVTNMGVRPYNGKNDGPPGFRLFFPIPPHPHPDKRR